MSPGGAMMAKDKIVVENLTKIFGENSERWLSLMKAGWSKERLLAEHGVTVGVCDVSFTVREGEIFVLMGLSGSGKSTLIRLINRLVEPTAGRVLIDGQDVVTLPADKLRDLRRRDMSMVFQSFALLPNRTVLDNAAFGLEVAGVGRKERERAAMEVLEQVGLKPFARKHPHELSGGMRQRVGLARALAVNPSLMIMDEAFSALDPLKRREMQDVLLQLQAEHKRTIVFVSHDIEEAFRIGNRIAIMEGGRLIQLGEPRQIIENPANDYVRAFFDGFDTSRYLTAADLLRADAVPVLTRQDNSLDFDADALLGELFADERGWCFVLDRDRRVSGALDVPTLRNWRAGHGPRELIRVEPVRGACRLDQIIPQLMRSAGPLPVVDDDGRYRGAINKRAVLGRLAAKGGALHG